MVYLQFGMCVVKTTPWCNTNINTFHSITHFILFLYVYVIFTIIKNANTVPLFVHTERTFKETNPGSILCQYNRYKCSNV